MTKKQVLKDMHCSGMKEIQVMVMEELGILMM